MPGKDALAEMKQRLFKGTDKDFALKIRILKQLIPRGRVLDYGSSWGYGSFQLKAAGYDCVGFEISKPRALFAEEHFGVQTLSELSDLDRYGNEFDAIFASHVLEHLPSLQGVFERLFSLLGPGGALLAFVPNCGGATARKLGVNWGPMCCEKHTIAFDAAFFERVLPRYSFDVVSFSDLCTETEFERLLVGDSIHRIHDGDELVVCARRRDGRFESKWSRKGEPKSAGVRR